MFAEGPTIALCGVQGLGCLRTRVLFEVLDSLLANVLVGRGDKESFARVPQ